MVPASAEPVYHVSVSAVRQQPTSKARASSKSKAKARSKASRRPTERRPRPSASGRLVRTYPGRRIGPVPLGPLIAWQVALAPAVIAWAEYRRGHPWLVQAAIAVIATIAVAILTLFMLNGRPLWRWFGVQRAFRIRNKLAQPALPHDPALVPLREWLPGLELATVAGKRGGSEVGVIFDGTGYTVLLGPDREDLIASADPVNIPLSAFASVGESEGIRLASAQLIVQTLPAPVPSLGAYGGHLAESYKEINTEFAPAMVSWWIALRLEPSRDGTALTLDGEDSDAVRRALRSAITWGTKVLSSSGLPSRPLGKGEVREVLALTLGVDPHHRPTSLKARRTAETRRGWTCDGSTHVTGWVRSWPKPGLPGMSRLLNAMAGLPVQASMASLAVSWSPENNLRWSGHVRIAAENPKTARAAYRQLAKQSSRGKVGLVRLDSEQLPGVLATIPLGGGA